MSPLKIFRISYESYCEWRKGACLANQSINNSENEFKLMELFWSDCRYKSANCLGSFREDADSPKLNNPDAVNINPFNVLSNFQSEDEPHVFENLGGGLSLNDRLITNYGLDDIKKYADNCKNLQDVICQFNLDLQSFYIENSEIIDFIKFNTISHIQNKEVFLHRVYQIKELLEPVMVYIN